MMHILDYIDEIANESSRKKKEELLDSWRHRMTYDELTEAKAVLDWTLSPNVDFYIKDLDSLPEANDEYQDHYTTVLYKLAHREVTGNAAKQLLSNLLDSSDPKTAELVKRIIKRDLRASLGVKTINKVFTDLIYDHPYMRASSLNEKTASKIEFPLICQTKMDGMYIDIIVKDGKVTYRSRKGFILPLNTPERDEQLVKVANGYVIQGEAIVKGDGESLEAILNRQEGNGYLNSSDIDPKRIVFYAWDAVRVEDFEAHETKQHYQERLAKVEKISFLVDFIELVDTQITHSFDETIALFKEKIAEGEEGLIVKLPYLKWKYHTSPHQLKMKVVAECDMVIVGFNPGNGKYEGMVGSVNIQSSDGKVFCGVSGFTDEMRQHLTDNIDKYIEEEKIITVKFNGLVDSEEKDTEALYLPRFVKLRADKSGIKNADSRERISDILNSYDYLLGL